MSRNPSFYGISLERSTFADYYRYHGQPERNYILEMGYSRSGWPDHHEVSKFFCQHFCDRFNVGWFSPVICNFKGAIWKSGVLQAIDAAFVRRIRTECRGGVSL
jgi:hypothetical protein